MNVNLNKSEIDVIEKALEQWENEPNSSGFSSLLMDVMFTSKEDRNKMGEDAMIEKVNKRHEAAANEVRRRKTVVILLRAKLIQAAANASEHEVENV